MSLFKVGDEVDGMFGYGHVVEIDETKLLYPVIVVFDSGDYASFAHDGKLYHDDKYPSIWHKETGTPSNVVERPFEYPIYKKSAIDGLIVKFDGLRSGEVVFAGDSWIHAGLHSTGWTAHTRDIWEDCRPEEIECLSVKEMSIQEIERELGHKIKVVDK